MSINGNANTQIIGENNSNVSTSGPTDKSTAPENDANKINRGYISDLKDKVSTKMANLVNRLVTRQVENRMLRCLPPEVKEDVQTKIEGTIQNMVTDISSKSFDTGLNIIKAAPGVGNAVSALSAADNVLAGIKNTKNSVFQIKEQIDNVQNQLNSGLASATNIPMSIPAPPKLNSLNAGLNNIPLQSGGNGNTLITNNLQTIIERAHHSVAQHHADVHHLIEHRDKIHTYRNKKNTKKRPSQKGGQTKPKTNNSQTILERASRSVAQHHGDLTHNVILKRTSKSIRDFHNTTKKLHRR
jgi:hypothetical protein